MKKPNCKCLACGKEYYFCLQCNQREPRPLPNWHLNFCDETCMTVFETVSSYCGGSITKDEAEEIIGTYDISEKNFKENIKEKIKEIQKKERPARSSFVDKEPKKEETKTVVEESKEDVSIGLMSPTADEKGEE